MDIRTKNTGRAFYQMPSELAAVLLELGLVEKIDKPAPTPKEPRWGIGMTGTGAACITYELTSGEVRRYIGHPDDAADGFKLRTWNFEKQAHVLEGPTPPKAVVDEYRALWKPPLR